MVDNAVLHLKKVDEVTVNSICCKSTFYLDVDNTAMLIIDYRLHK